MAAKQQPKRGVRPKQKQTRQPGVQRPMRPQPLVVRDDYKASGKLKGRVAIITGGDSGIGRSVAVLFAMEGADVAVVYLDEHEDARETKRLVEEKGRSCLLIAGDVGSEAFCKRMLAELGIACTPGIDFDPARGRATIRFSFAGATATMAEAARRLKAWGR